MTELHDSSQGSEHGAFIQSWHERFNEELVDSPPPISGNIIVMHWLLWSAYLRIADDPPSTILGYNSMAEYQTEHGFEELRGGYLLDPILVQMYGYTPPYYELFNDLLRANFDWQQEALRAEWERLRIRGFATTDNALAYVPPGRFFPSHDLESVPMQNMLATLEADPLPAPVQEGLRRFYYNMLVPTYGNPPSIAFVFVPLFDGGTLRRQPWEIEPFKSWIEYLVGLGMIFTPPDPIEVDWNNYLGGAYGWRFVGDPTSQWWGGEWIQPLRWARFVAGDSMPPLP